MGTCFKKQALFIFAILFVLPAMAQSQGNLLTDSIKKNFVMQSILFPQEKVYVQNDKPYYVTGEDIWFRAYLVDAVSHIADYSSRYVYAELINPENEVSVRVKVKPTSEAYSGYITIPEDLPSGDYQLRFYTRLMENMDDAYFFKKKIKIGDPLIAAYRTQVTFKYKKKDKVAVEMEFIDMKTGKPIFPDEVRVKNDTKFFESGGQKFKKFKQKDNSKINFDLNDPKERYGNYFYIEYDYLQKFHKEYIPIPSADDDFDVAFLPEGGNLPAGVNSIVAFKSINANGMGEDITGRIENGKGDLVTEIKSQHKGMGSFMLNAMNAETYYAVCKNGKNIEKRYELPKAKANTYSLQAKWQKENLHILVNKSSDIQSLQDIYLIIHCRGTVLYAAPWDASKEHITIDKNILPTGVVHLILADAKQNLLSERLIFSQNKKDETKLAFRTDKPEYGKREKVKVSLNLADIENRPAMAALSVSVTDDKDVNPDTGVNILSSILLTSELKGYIESPATYFTDTNVATTANLDILMMTQGWRRYNVPDVLKGKFEEPNLVLEIGQEVSGVVTSVAREKPVKGAEVGIYSSGANYFNIVHTDENGRFVFNGFEYPERTTYLVRAINDKGSDWTRLVLDKETFPQIKPYGMIDLSTTEKEEKTYESFIEKADNRYVLMNGMRMIYLKEVEIKAKILPNMATGPIALISDKTYTYKDIEEKEYHSIVDILQNTGGAIMAGNHLILRSQFSLGDANPEPAVYIDGVHYEPGITGTGIIGFLEEIDIHDVKQIDIIKTMTQIFGPNGSKGVINITLKDGSEPTAPPRIYNMETITPQGYQPAKEFYSPKYQTLDQKNVNTPDLRTTIYWNPNVTTSLDGEAVFEFYTADTSSSYSVVIEGITADGQLVHSVEKINLSK